jgi:putative ABC transport system substrate-binding protein
MISRRQLVIALGAGALVAPFGSFAQRPAGPRIGFLGASSASDYSNEITALRAGLRDLGYLEGKNIALEYRWAESKYDRLPELAAELVYLNVDVLVTDSSTATIAARRATAVTPIVMAKSGDPIAAGLVTNLARPGGNITGLTFFTVELDAKRLELLKDAMPRITKVAVLLNPDTANNKPALEAMESAARSLKLGLHSFEVRRVNEFEAVFKTMAKQRMDAVAIRQDPMLTLYPGAIAEFSIMQRLPSVGNKEYGESGGLIGYGVNFLDMYRRTAHYVDKILKGSKPGDIPIERATKFELVANMKTAKALGVKIPQSILVQATKVLE